MKYANNSNLSSGVVGGGGSYNDPGEQFYTF